MKDSFDLVARIFVSAISIFESYDTIEHIGRTRETLLQYGLSWYPLILIYVTSLALFIGGVFLLIGYRSGFAASLLLLYWIPVTFIVYSFWNDPPETRNIQAVHFMKNIAFIGGMIHILVHGTGKYAVRRFFGVTKLPKEKW